MTKRAQAARSTAVAWSLIATAYFVVVPVYGTSAEAVWTSAGPSTPHTVPSGRLLDANPQVAIALVVPVLLSAFPLFFRRHRAQRSATFAAAVLLTGACALGAMTIGLFYLPGALALWLAAGLDGRAPPAA